MMKRNVMIMLLLMTIALLSLPPIVRADMQLSLFKSDSYQKIAAQYQDDSFLMVLWSVDCPPCIEELPALGKFHQMYPKAKVVMVSTDSINQQQDIQQLMVAHGLGDIQQWVFDGESVQAIRFAIDPAWYGELPRSYFHQLNKKRQAKSGRLDERALLTWIASIKNTTSGL
jgi:thiol-disulfide isomerase/thioredoxin